MPRDFTSRPNFSFAVPATCKSISFSISSNLSLAGSVLMKSLKLCVPTVAFLALRTRLSRLRFASSTPPGKLRLNFCGSVMRQPT